MATAEHFIPYSKVDIIRMCAEEGTLSSSDVLLFKDACKLVSSIFHFKFHSSLELLKESYAPVNPDLDTKTPYSKIDDDKEILEIRLVSELKTLLNAANFEEITQADLDRALQEESLFKIKLNVDFNDFEQVLFFRRGESIKQETLSSWFGLKKKTITFINYDRVVIYVKYKDQQYFEKQKRKQLFFQPGSTIIKLFQNIPRADLEMLFPNTEVRMKTIDKLIIGVPAVVGGIIMLATKLGATLLLTWTLIAFWLNMHQQPVILDQTALLGLAAGFGALGAFLWKQFSNFKNRKIQFMKTLTDSLYFKNLDNNTGVFHRLIDAAEEEECKETILAYYFLLRAESSLDSISLDHEIERWFQKKYQCSFDFEISDAITKLIDLGLVTQSGGQFSAIPLRDARVQLDTLWDGYFEFDH
ncbi:MAG: DUF3754 domain-containing protein [Methylophaga sp.]|nr:DUF3754 domain-containing protein [Methylophaga sp.]